MTSLMLPPEQRADTVQTTAVFKVTSNFRRSRVQALRQHTTSNAAERFRLSNAGRIVNALRVVAIIHAPSIDERDTCWECGLSWPCPTIDAVHTILTSETGVIPDGTDQAGRRSDEGTYRLDPRPGDI